MSDSSNSLLGNKLILRGATLVPFLLFLFARRALFGRDAGVLL